jgi:hypothetical protein
MADAEPDQDQDQPGRPSPGRARNV